MHLYVVGVFKEGHRYWIKLMYFVTFWAQAATLAEGRPVLHISILSYDVFLNSLFDWEKKKPQTVSVFLM